MINPVRILIADDHQMIIDGIKGMLQLQDKYVITAEANDGQAALSLIAAAPQQYDLLLTDVSMPLVTGPELCVQVKALYPHIKVLMLSMYAGTAVVKEAIMVEADGYILKKAGKDEMLTALHRISEDGTYFSEEILPVIYRQYHKERQQNNHFTLLTSREKEVLDLIVKEMTSEEIAQKLFISKKTVDTHRAHLLEKSQSRSTIGLVKFAIKNGLADL
jgi:DNA-binding NarL/FixJ family response regulator